MNKFEIDIQHFISSLSLLNKDHLYLVALSGGADSVSLLRCLHALHYRIEAVHCNFHLRGEESDRDERFCKNLCQQLGIRLHLIHFDTRTYAQKHHISIEMAARQQRYAYFESLMLDTHAKGICVGHHQEDSVETFLINLVRSTGIHGLTGIAPKNGTIIRPLLCISKKDIISYLNLLHQNYVTDSTNFVADVQRNKIRLDIIPQLEKINIAAQSNILKTAQRLNDIAHILDNYMAQFAQWIQHEYYLSFPTEQVTHEYLLWYLLRNYQFSSAQVEQIYHCLSQESGKIWLSPTHQLLLERKQLLLAQHTAFPTRQLSITTMGRYTYSAKTMFQVSLYENVLNKQIFKDKRFAFVDYDKVVFPLVVRPTQQGDRFQPYGMKGTKLLSDYLTNCKMSLFDKRLQLVVTDATHRIMWVVNQRLANWCAVTDTTNRILQIQRFVEEK